MKSKKVDKAREKSEDICRLYLESNKNGCVVISEIYGVSPGTILNILRENGVEIRDNSESQMGLQVKENNPNYIGGNISPDGYRRIYEQRIGNYRRTCVLEHVFVIEQFIERRLRPQIEVVHHINGNKLDNRLKNLQLLTRSEHIKLHKNIK